MEQDNANEFVQDDICLV